MKLRLNVQVNQSHLERYAHSDHHRALKMQQDDALQSNHYVDAKVCIMGSTNKSQQEEQRCDVRTTMRRLEEITYCWQWCRAMAIATIEKR